MNKRKSTLKELLDKIKQAHDELIEGSKQVKPRDLNDKSNNCCFEK